MSSTMHCPHCTHALRAMIYEGVSIHTCDGCGGEFLGAPELASIVKTRETVFGPHLKKLFDDHAPMFGMPSHEVQRDLCCPACLSAMQLVNYSGDSGVCIDRCTSCGGVWLDSQELEKVQIILENWQDRAPGQLKSIATQLERTRMASAARTSNVFRGSRFSFVNAVINRLLDAA